MYDVIYTKPEKSDELVKTIKDRWPTATVIVTTDTVYGTRMSIAISDVSEDEFYPWAMMDGYALSCRGLQVLMGHRDLGPRVDHWIELAEKMKEANNEASV